VRRHRCFERRSLPEAQVAGLPRPAARLRGTSSGTRATTGRKPKATSSTVREAETSGGKPAADDGCLGRSPKRQRWPWGRASPRRARGQPARDGATTTDVEGRSRSAHGMHGRSRLLIGRGGVAEWARLASRDGEPLYAPRVLSRPSDARPQHSAPAVQAGSDVCGGQASCGWPKRVARGRRRLRDRPEVGAGAVK